MRTLAEVLKQRADKEKQHMLMSETKKLISNFIEEEFENEYNDKCVSMCIRVNKRIESSDIEVVICYDDTSINDICYSKISAISSADDKYHTTLDFLISVQRELENIAEKAMYLPKKKEV